VTSVQPRALFVSLIAPGDSRTYFGWRLLGANNRELGRGSNASKSLDDCADEVSMLAAQCGLIVFANRRARSNDGWTWNGALDRREVVHSSRSFRRERECVYNVEAFTEALAYAEVRIPADASRLPQVASSLFVSGPIDLTDGALARVTGGKSL